MYNISVVLSLLSLQNSCSCFESFLEWQALSSCLFLPGDDRHRGTAWVEGLPGHTRSEASQRLLLWSYSPDRRSLRLTPASDIFPLSLFCTSCFVFYLWLLTSRSPSPPTLDQCPLSPDIHTTNLEVEPSFTFSVCRVAVHVKHLDLMSAWSVATDKLSSCGAIILGSLLSVECSLHPRHQMSLYTLNWSGHPQIQSILHFTDRANLRMS